MVQKKKPPCKCKAKCKCKGKRSVTTTRPAPKRMPQRQTGGAVKPVKVLPPRKRKKLEKKLGKVVGNYVKVGSAIGKELRKPGNAKKQSNKLESQYKKGLMNGVFILLGS